MRRRIGIFGASDEALQLIPLLLANAELEIAGIYDSDSSSLRERLEILFRNGRNGFILVFVVLALFLRLRLAFWVALGVPIAFLGAL